MNTYLILIIFASHFIRYGIVFPLVPLLAERLGASASIIGFTVGAFSIIAIFISIPLGGLVDRFGVKKMLLLGVICNIVNAVILIQINNVLELIIAQMIAGLAFLLHVVSSQAFFSRLSESSMREKGFGLISFVAAAGQGVGPILGGVIVNRFDYQAAFWVVLVFSSMGLVVIGLKITDDFNTSKLPYNLVQDIRQAVFMIMDLRIFTILIFTFAISFAANIQTSFLPIFLRTEGLSESIVGLLISVFALTSTSIRIFFGKLLQIFNRKKMLILSMLTVVLGVIMIPLMFSVAGYAAMVSIFGLGFGIAQPLSMVMITDSVESNLSGLSMGLRFTAIMGASLLSPVILGFIVDNFSLKSAFYFAALVVTFAGIRVVISIRKLDLKYNGKIQEM